MNVELNRGDKVRVIVGQFKGRAAMVITTYEEHVVIEIERINLLVGKRKDHVEKLNE